LGRRIETVLGDDLTRYCYDGQRILAKTRPPYSVELDLGDAPRTHRLEAVAEAVDGSELARDQLLVNAGPHRFGVRLVEPRAGGRYRQSLKANAVVDVPEGERLERVEIWVDEQRVATLYSRPFVQPLLLPPEAEAGEMVYVRAVAYLEGGASAEDVVFVNTPDYLEEMEIDFVELYTSVLDRRGRPVDGLSAADFQVFENDEPQEIRRFELVRDLPIHAGVLLDTSTSMLEEIDEAVDAAVTFFETVITPKDRAAVITFDDEPELAVRFTSDLDTLSASLAGLDPRGETALWDSVVYGLYYFAGTQGKRVIVLISDGEDSKSRYRFDDALDYARRTGVAIYTVGLGFDTRQSEARSHLTKLADETGGRSFFIQRVSQLEGVYGEIEDELRSQYLLAYQSAQPSPAADDAGEFREIRVDVAAPGTPGAEAKTVKGYYP
jgi:VWFA-related protein